jgi:hypothetical protein
MNDGMNVVREEGDQRAGSLGKLKADLTSQFQNEPDSRRQLSGPL